MICAAVVFDMDGLMLDTEPVYKRAWQRAARELDHPISDELYLSLIGRNETDSERMLCAALGPTFPLNECRRRWENYSREEVRNSGIARKPGLTELLAFIDSQRIPSAVATSSHREQAQMSLAAGGLEDYFEVVVTGDQIVRGKPAPDIYLTAARKLAVRPEQCIALEDSEPGALAAAAAGMTTLMIPDLKAPSPDAKRAATAILPSLYEARTFLEDRKVSQKSKTAPVGWR